MTASTAAAELGLGLTRFSQLYADYLRACAARCAPYAFGVKPKLPLKLRAAERPPVERELRFDA